MVPDVAGEGFNPRPGRAADLGGIKKSSAAAQAQKNPYDGFVKAPCQAGTYPERGPAMTTFHLGGRTPFPGQRRGQEGGRSTTSIQAWRLSDYYSYILS